MPLKRFLLGTAFALALVPTVNAEQVKPAAGTVPPLALFGPLPPPPAPPVQVDESALRYYAAQNDAARIAAEIRRLQTENPGWTPPVDLYATDRAPDIDVGPLWALYAEGRYADLHAALKEIRTNNPDAPLPNDLLDALADGETVARLVAASNMGNDAGVVEAARSRPTLLSCARIDIVWSVAEALGRLGDVEKSLTAFDYALTRCADAPQRLATVQKASLVLPETAVDRLIATGATNADGTNEFQAVLDDRVRRRVAAVIPSAVPAVAPAPLAALTTGPDPLVVAPPQAAAFAAAPADLARLELLARQTRSSADAGLLGWYHYAAANLDVAETWFRTAAGFAEDPKAIEGLILTLQRKGDQRAAEDLAYRARALSPDLAKLHVEVTAAALTTIGAAAYPADRLAAMEEAVRATHSAFGAEALGWYRYNTKDFKAAKHWFEQSLSVLESEGAHLGAVLTAQSLGERSRAATLLAELAPRYPSIAALKDSVANASVASDGGQVRVRLNKRPKESASDTRQAVALYEGKRYQEAISLLEKIAASGKETQDLAVLRGWAYYNTRQYSKARDIFAAADARGSTSATRTGLYYSKSKTRAPFYR